MTIVKHSQLDDELSDYLLEQERDCRRQRKRLSSKELIEAFPDALPSIRTKIEDWKIISDELFEVIGTKLKHIKDLETDDFSKWFCREWVKQTDGQELMIAEKHITRLKRLLWATEKRKPPKDWIDEDQKCIALEVPIESLLETDYRTSGRTVCSLCPFHGEKTPSFYVYTDTNRYWCYGCNQGGDSINFIRSLYNFTFKEAVEYLTRQ